MFKLEFFLIFFMVLFKVSIADTPHFTDRWIVWNIGQGQWVTHSLTNRCIHYDLGGELNSFKFVKRKILLECSTKRNEIILSHWDFDHYLNIKNMAQVIPNICWRLKPAVTKLNKSIQEILNLNIHDCTYPSEIKTFHWATFNGKSTNDLSIVNFDHGFLIPGDSTIEKEKKWSHELQEIKNTKILILGHHGSRTSTGTELLNHLPNLKLAIASARIKKYGHPHLQTLQRLQKNKTPVLKTEDWGSIWFL